ncbi:hypothetical protein ABZX39_34735 [Streptomyces collinus]
MSGTTPPTGRRTPATWPGRGWGGAGEERLRTGSCTTMAPRHHDPEQSYD